MVSVPNWDWLTVLAKDASGKFQVHSLVGYTKAMGGAFATTVKRHDMVFVLKGYYSPETERFVTEHELGHVRHNHLPRMMAVGQFGVMDQPKFEVEADMHAASVVGWSNAYYALTEVQQKICQEFGREAEDGVRKIAVRKVAMMEKWKSTSMIPV
jgi:Zn-dependent protease with chaperone function